MECPRPDGVTRADGIGGTGGGADGGGEADSTQYSRVVDIARVICLCMFRLGNNLIDVDVYMRVCVQHAEHAHN
jgi:hypothetical protein